MRPNAPIPVTGELESTTSIAAAMANAGVSSVEDVAVGSEIVVPPEMRALVIGGRGFIGAPLVERLATLGVDVVALGRRAPLADAAGVRWIQGDSADEALINRVISDYRPDYVFHLATGGRNARELAVVSETFRNDLKSMVVVLTAAAENGAKRIIVTGSLEEPSEQEDWAPMSPYAAAKFACGAYARMFRRVFETPVVSLRPFMGYGPGQAPEKIVQVLVSAALRGEAPRLSSGRKRVDWVYIDDLVDGFVRAAVCPLPENRTIDLGSGQLHSIREVAELVHELCPGSPAPLFGVLPDRLGDEAVRLADLGPAREQLGWQATVSLRDGLKRTLEHARAKLAGVAALATAAIGERNLETLSIAASVA